MPSGPHDVGTTTIVVTDGGREGRRIPVQLWYPAMPGTGDASAPYAPPATAALLADQVAVPDEDVSGIETHSRGDASPELSAGALPVVLVSPGYEVTRSSYSGYGAELASHGYLVAVLDHPGDGKLVEYPDGSTVPGEGSADFESLVAARASDARAVLDELGRLDGPLSGALDLDRVAFVGHSLGGATAAETMRLDPRVDVGVNLDGSMLGPVLETGLERPFLLMGGAGEEDETWRTFFSRSPAGEWLVIDGAAHMAFSDVPVLCRAAAGGGADRRPVRDRHHRSATVGRGAADVPRGLPRSPPPGHADDVVRRPVGGPSRGGAPLTSTDAARLAFATENPGAERAADEGEGTGMTSGLDTVRRIVEHWHELRPEDWRELCTPDVRYQNMPWDRKIWEGPDAVHQVLGELAERWDCTIDVHQLGADGDVAFAERTEHYVAKESGTGEPFEVPVYGLFELRDGRVAAWRDYFDRRALRA